MSDMRCGNCGRYGIQWVGDLLLNPSTRCPHCGGQNCQEPPITWDDEEDEKP